MSKTIAKVWTFESSSSDKTYETLQYTDGTTSCNCPGWTRRVAADGSRTCKHTRLVDQGLADSESVSHKEYGKVSWASSMAVAATKGTTPATTAKKTKKVSVSEDSPTDPMEKDLKELDKNWERKRKISWK